MGSTTWGWLLAIVGTLASVAGVVFSCMAWMQASKARDAAMDAADAVRVRNLSQDFSRWSNDARELLWAVRELRFENAQRAATDLLGALAHNKGWQSGLRRESSVREVEEIVRLLTLVNTYMTEGSVFVAKQARLVVHCQAIYLKLNELSGNLDAESEQP